MSSTASGRDCWIYKGERNPVYLQRTSANQRPADDIDDSPYRAARIPHSTSLESLIRQKTGPDLAAGGQHAGKQGVRPPHQASLKLPTAGRYV